MEVSAAQGAKAIYGNDREARRLTLDELIGVLVAAGGPSEIDVRAPWPLHQTLRYLQRSHADTGILPDLDFVPCPKAGEAAVGAGAALLTLAAEGVINADTATGGHVLRFTDGPRLRPYRKRLLGQELRTAAVIYQAATSWRTRSETAAKTLAKARESCGAMSVVATPNFCQGPPGFVRCFAMTRSRPDLFIGVISTR